MVAFPTMEAFFPTLISLLLLFSSIACFNTTFADSQAATIAFKFVESSFGHESPTIIPQQHSRDVKIPNPCLRNAYTAIQALKKAIHSDPKNFTGNWVGSDVCSYNGIFCAAVDDNSSHEVVASVDLNSAELEGFLPDELGLLADIAVFHANSNRFHGSVPDSLAGLKRVVEFDVSNNRLAGGFPKAALQMPALRYLDLRFNGFDGPLPPELFDKGLDALFLNNNRFHSDLPENFGNLTASVAVLANNYLAGCIPKSIGKMRHLNELVLTNNRLDGCLPAETGMLSYLTVFDVGFNLLSGFLPESLAGLRNLEELHVSHNLLIGAVPKGVCKLPKLANFTFSHNYFNEDSRECARRKEGRSYLILRATAFRRRCNREQQRRVLRLQIGRSTARSSSVGTHRAVSLCRHRSM
ncbi:hypothetical protein HPP92_002131 [Vanilla planifolia]|uniref:Cell wall hydroxyproline-rich glycoprotein n=1 Tax=Vanilla planifolia TaxID=51239 RepID=A0A835VHQ3_VANPL|nr:hypothetical protein HPP92_002131 [Vanilla planifolia]